MAYLYCEIDNNKDKIGFNCKNIVKFIINYMFWSYGAPDDENNYIKKKVLEEKQILRKVLDNKYRIGKVKVRNGQNMFKNDLITLIGECQICGMKNKRMLIASHIKPYHKSELDEAIDFDNGFLLCSHHDGLFDSGLISFDDDGKIIISDELTEDDRQLPINVNLNEAKIKIREEQKKYLKWHREHIFK